jgi:cell volume regulation protein A
VTDGQLLLAAGALLAGGLAASLLATRVRIPGLVLVLGVGMAIGSDGTGWIEFSDYEVARTVGIVALSLILFEGGLAAGFDEIRPVLGPAIALAVLGTLLTAVLTGLTAAWLFNLSTLEGLLLGSILASTDGAAVFAVLRGSTLRRRLARTLEGEAGLNDPVAVLLVLGFSEWILRPEDYGAANMALEFVLELGIGLVVGLAAGAGAVYGLKRVTLASAGLYPVTSIAVVALAYGAGDVLHGSGFLAVYIAGLVLGSARIPARRTITTFHDGLAWVAQLGMFLTLGLLVFPKQLGEVALEGTALALIAAALARPAAVIVSTAFARFELREQLVLGWAGLRGAVPVVLATFPVIDKVPDSARYFNIVFFAVLLSTVLQGSTFQGLARRLGVTTTEAAIPAPLIEPAAIRALGAEVIEFQVEPGHAAAGARVRELGLPRDALLNLVVRERQAIPPRGSMRVQAGDRLHVLVRQEAALEFGALLERWRSGPIDRQERRAVRARGTAIVFSTGPWDPADGDPGRPQRVRGVEVAYQSRTRRDRPGAVVALVDGRWAFTGPVVAVGSPSQVQEAARRRLRTADDEADGAWWREVIGSLAAP